MPKCRSKSKKGTDIVAYRGDIRSGKGSPRIMGKLPCINECLKTKYF